MALLSFATLGSFTAIWLNHWHGVTVKTRGDDPGVWAAIGGLFVPIYSLFWIFTSLLRLCERLDDELAEAGLERRAPKELVRWFAIFSVIPGINILISPFLGAVTTARLQSIVNLLAESDRQMLLQARDDIVPEGTQP